MNEKLRNAHAHGFGGAGVEAATEWPGSGRIDT
jgi:hypothetical protein